MSIEGRVQAAVSDGTHGPSTLQRFRATKRALIVLSGLLDVRLLSPAVNAGTRRPRAESIEIAGVPTELVTPAGTGPWPAFVLVTGAHPLRRREPIVMKVAEGLGRAGFVVVVPDLPGLGEGQISPHTVDSTVRVVEWTAQREEVAGGRIVLCGASVGGSLALIVAGRPEVADSVGVVSSICPFADLEKMICLATTRCYGHDGPVGAYDAAILLRRVVARSLLATLPEGSERTRLLDRVGDILNDQEDPIDRLLTLDGQELGPGGRAIVDLLTNTDAGKFRELYEGLPADAHALVELLSPLPRATAIRARVELAVPPLDPYFPPGETQALAAAIPNARLIVSGTLDHTRPMKSRAHLGDLTRYSGFVLRTLADW